MITNLTLIDQLLIVNYQLSIVNCISTSHKIVYYISRNYHNAIAQEFIFDQHICLPELYIKYNE